MKEKNIITVVKCPQCGKPVPWKESQKYRPFCSNRCKLIDLGDWASEKHMIPGEEIDQILIDKNDSE